MPIARPLVVGDAPGAFEVLLSRPDLMLPELPISMAINHAIYRVIAQIGMDLSDPLMDLLGRKRAARQEKADRLAEDRMDRLAADPDCRRDGGSADLRACGGHPCRDELGRHDGGLGEDSRGRPRADVQSHHQ